MGYREHVVMVWLLFMGMNGHAQDEQQIPIRIVICSYNNAQWYEANLASVLIQDYSNYRILYIDDESTDKTADLVEQFCSTYDAHHRVTLKRNSRRVGALRNIYDAVHATPDGTIIVLLDGDDRLKDKEVLSRINAAYASGDVWMTYGQFEEYPGGKQGFCAELPSAVIQWNLYREYSWVTSHVRTFRSELFKQIKLGDLVNQGQFPSAGWDLVFMYPLLEMAAGRLKFIPEIQYIYNQASPLNDFRLKCAEQLTVTYRARSGRKYTPLKELRKTMPTEAYQGKTDVYVLSEDAPEYAYAALETMQIWGHGFGTTHLVYRATSDEDRAAYNFVRALFPAVHAVPVDQCASWTQTVCTCMSESQQPYVFLLKDGVIMRNTINAPKIVAMLEKTKAHGWYACLSPNIKKTRYLTRFQKLPPLVDLEDDFYAWKSEDGEYDWRVWNSLCGGLYRMQECKQLIHDIKAYTIEELDQALQAAPCDTQAMGLLSQQASAYTVTVDRSMTRTKLLDGYALNIAGMRHDAASIMVDGVIAMMSMQEGIV